MTEIEAKRKRGRPSKYSPEMVRKYAFLAARGLIDEEIADVLGVTRETLHNWTQEYPEFFDSKKAAKAMADEKVERSLFEMATGYSYETEKALVVSDGSSVGSHVEKVIVRETIPPNPTSMIFWLKNRRPDRWRDKQEVALDATFEIKHTFDPEGI